MLFISVECSLQIYLINMNIFQVQIVQRNTTGSLFFPDNLAYFNIYKSYSTTIEKHINDNFSTYLHLIYLLIVNSQLIVNSVIILLFTVMDFIFDSPIQSHQESSKEPSTQKRQTYSITKKLAVVEIYEKTIEILLE